MSAELSASIDIFLKVTEIGSILIGGSIVIFKVGGAIKKFEQVALQQGQEISELKNSVRELSSLITNQARFDERISGFGSRLTRLENKIDELSHGEGFVMPLVKGARPG